MPAAASGPPGGSGWVTFRLGTRELAAPLEEVLEVVRGVDVAVLVLRGQSHPVVELRPVVGATVPGDVLVLAGEGEDRVAVAVDRVLAVLPLSDLVPGGPVPAAGTPSYVRGVLRPVDGSEPLPLVSLLALSKLRRAGQT